MEYIWSFQRFQWKNKKNRSKSKNLTVNEIKNVYSLSLCCQWQRKNPNKRVILLFHRKLEKTKRKKRVFRFVLFWFITIFFSGLLFSMWWYEICYRRLVHKTTLRDFVHVIQLYIEKDSQILNNKKNKLSKWEQAIFTFDSPKSMLLPNSTHTKLHDFPT